MNNVILQFNEHQLKIISDAVKAINQSTDPNISWYGAYDAVIRAIDDAYQTPDQITDDNRLEVDAVHVWLQGALKVNSGVGAFSELIRKFTLRELQLNVSPGYTEAEVAEAMQVVSNEIGQAVIEHGILNFTGNGDDGGLASIETIADRDASQATSIFNSLGPTDTAVAQASAWSGTLLFSMFAKSGLPVDETDRLISAGEAKKLDTIEDFRNLLFGVDSFVYGLEEVGVSDATLDDILIGFDLVNGDGQGPELNFFDAFNAALFENGSYSEKILKYTVAGDEASDEISFTIDQDRYKLVDSLGALFGYEYLTANADDFLINANQLFSNLRGSGDLSTPLRNIDIESEETIVANAIDSIAYRYALLNLNPFVVEGDTSLYDIHNINGELDLYDEETSEGQLTENWIEKRAAFLTASIKYNESGDEGGVLSWISSFPEWQWSDVNFKDLALGDSASLSVQGLGTNLSDASEVVFGSEAEERLVGGDNDDAFFGMAGSDSLTGGLGEDILEGGSGNDALYANSWNSLWGGGERDTGTNELSGGEGEDRLYGSDGNDLLDGGNDRDKLMGGAGEDTLIGGGGDDLLIGAGSIVGPANFGWWSWADDKSVDVLKGGEGDDTYIIGMGDVINDTDGKGRIFLSGSVWEAYLPSVSYTGNPRIMGAQLGGKVYGGGGVWDKYDHGKAGLKKGVIKYIQSGSSMLVVADFSEDPDNIENSGVLVTIENFTSGDFGIELIDGLPVNEPSSRKPAPTEEPEPVEPPPARDPLTFDLNGDGIVDTLSIDDGVNFDLDNNGFAERTSWVAPEDGLLVLDRNANDIIDGGAELFGTETQLQNGEYAENGFEALKEFDVNLDGIIDAKDEVFSDLRVWQDANSNGVAETEELKSLTDLNIESINTTYETNSFTDENNVEHREHSEFTRTDGSTDVVDTLWFESDRQETVPVEILNGDGIAISEEISFLPDATGYGNVYSLRQAMALDSSGELQTLVEEFVNTPDLDTRETLVSEIMVVWTSSGEISETAMRGDVNARELAVMEAIWGQPAAAINPTGRFADLISQSYRDFHSAVTAQMLTSFYNPASDLFDLIEPAQSWVADESGDSLVYISDLSVEGGLLSESGNWVEAEGDDFSQVISHLLFLYKSSNEQAKNTLENFHKITLGLSTEMADAFIAELEAAIVVQEESLQQELWSSIRRYDDVYSGTEGNDLYQGYEGNDIIDGNNGNDTLDGGVGNDQINGGNGNDILIGGKGSDQLTGGQGNDVYLYSLGDGNDLINNFDNGNDRYDGLRFSEGIESDNVVVKQDGYDLVLTINDENTVVVYRYFYAQVEGQATFDALGGYQLDAIEFSDGTEWGVDHVKQLALQASDSNDQINGYSSDDVINGLEGNDTISGKNGSDTLFGNEGEDTLYGGNDSDTLSGGADDDRLYGDSGNDTLEGGQGNDRLEGGQGNDVYLYSLGDGHDHIQNYDLSENRFDVLRFAEGISSDDVKARQDGYDLVLNISDGNTITVDSYFRTKVILSSISYTYSYDAKDGYHLDAIEFSDGTVWGLDEVKSLVHEATNDDDQMQGYSSDDTLNGGEGNDTLYGHDGNDTLSGDAGNDYLNGGDGVDFLSGGAGDDTIYGGNNDSLLGDDILNGGEGDDTLYGGSGNDQLNGGEGQDKLYGEDGDDTLTSVNGELEGGAGNDVYIYHAGDGDISISNHDDAENRYDVIRLGAGIDPSQLSLTITGSNNNGYDLNIMIEGQGTITVARHFANFIQPKYTNNSVNFGYAINAIEFNDGTIWDLDTLNSLSLKGTDAEDYLHALDAGSTLEGKEGDDILSGGLGSDVLDGGAGDDTLYGGEGNDTYLYGMGDGNDIIRNVESNVGTFDKLKFDESIRVADVKLARTHSDLILEISNGQTITIDDYFTIDSEKNYVLNAIEFFDGTIWDYDKVKETLTVATAGDDSLYGDAADDQLNGSDGNDALNGQGGNDLLLGENGNDLIFGNDQNDILVGGNGDDYLAGGSGQDTYRFGTGFGTDSVHEYSSPELSTIELMDGLTSSDFNLLRYNNSLVLALDGSDSDAIIINLYFSITYDGSGYEFNDGSLLDPSTTQGVYLKADSSALSGMPGEFSDEDVIKGNASKIISGSTRQFIGYKLAGTLHNDILIGQTGNDQLLGQEGDDILIGGTGDDLLKGGEGNDRYIINLGDGNDEISDWGGQNTLVFGDGITFENLSLVDPTEGSSDFNSWEFTIAGGQSVELYSKYMEWYEVEGQSYSKEQLLEQFVQRNPAPTVEETFDEANPDREALVQDQAFSLDLPVWNMFADDLLDNLTYEITLSDGSPLPSWLNANFSNGTLSGTPNNSSVGSFTLLLTATDKYGASVSTSFELVVDNVNDAPVVNVGMSSMTAVEGNELLFSVPANAFSDIDAGDSLTFNATQVDGSALPSWIQFDSQTGQFSGSPSLEDAGVETILITATDNAGASVSTQFNLTIQTALEAQFDQTIDGTSSGEQITGQSGKDLIRAGAGDDSVYGFAGNDRLEGGDGNDRLQGGNGSNTNSGDDTLIGGEGNDILVGEDGNDFLDGGNGNDHYYYYANSGQDVITDAGTGQDILFFNDVSLDRLSFQRVDNDLIVQVDGDANQQVKVENHFLGGNYEISIQPNGGFTQSPTDIANLIGDGGTDNGGTDNGGTVPDVNPDDFDSVIEGTSVGEQLQGTSGNDLMKALEGDDQVFAFGGNDHIEGGAGDDYLAGGNGSYSGSGDDQIYGGEGNDILIGEDGNDLLDGGNGDDHYYIKANNGVDTVQDSGDGQDILFFNDVSLDRLSFHQSGNDLLVLIDSDLAQQVIVKDHFLGGDHEIMVQPNGGFTQTPTAILALLTALPGSETGEPNDGGTIPDVNPDDFDSVVEGTSVGEQLLGTSGNDLMKSLEGDDQVFAFGGNDHIEGGAGDDYLAGGNGSYSGSGDDQIYGGEGNDVLVGEDGNDLLDGGNGDDHYYIKANNGVDTVQDSGDGQDVVFFNDVSLDRLSFHQTDDDLIILVDGDLAQQVLVKDHFLGGDHEIMVQPNGGFTQTASDILALLTPLDTGSETPDPEVPDPEVPVNEIDLSGDNNITGSVNNDVIATGDGNDTLSGLAGNDALIGGKGNDLYLVGSDSGSDTIFDYEGNNTIRFIDGISFNDVASGLTKSGDDLILRVGSTGDEVRIERFFTLANTIENVDFESGGSISAGQLYGAFGVAAPTATEVSGDIFAGDSEDNSVTGSNGHDVVISGAGNDTLLGLEGNDQLVGGDGDDIYRIGASSGSDTVIDTAGSNKVLFTDGIAFNDVASGLMKSGNDLILKVGSTGNEVRITQFFSAANTIESVEFESGGAISAAQLFGVFGVTAPDQAVVTESGFGMEALASAMSSFDVPDDAGSTNGLISTQNSVEEVMNVA